MPQVRASVPTGPGRSHHQMWDEALDAALQSASQLGKGTFDVQIQFSATITVTNPGRIQAYAVTLSTTP